VTISHYRQSYVGFRLQQKSLTLNDLECQFADVVSFMRIVTKRRRLESRGFRYKVALYLSYMHIKLNDEIKGKGISSNFKHSYVLACVES